MYQFGKTSKDRLLTCDPRIQKILNIAIQRSKVDFGIACGHRTLAEQQKAFAEKKSEKDGIILKSKHQTLPSIAVDVYAWVENRANYGLIYMAYLAGTFNDIAMELGYDLHWGYNWNDNGVLGTDQTFQDSGHHELNI